MKPIVYKRYGPPGALELRDIEVPSASDDGVLVRMRAGPADLYDVHVMHAEGIWV